MDRNEILAAITEKEYVNSEMTMYRTHLSPEKLADFLAEHIAPKEEGNKG